MTQSLVKTVHLALLASLTVLALSPRVHAEEQSAQSVFGITVSPFASVTLTAEDLKSSHRREFLAQVAPDAVVYLEQAYLSPMLATAFELLRQEHAPQTLSNEALARQIIIEAGGVNQ